LPALTTVAATVSWDCFWLDDFDHRGAAHHRHCSLRKDENVGFAKSGQGGELGFRLLDLRMTLALSVRTRGFLPSRDFAFEGDVSQRG
jgi:hypothetical protein